MRCSTRAQHTCPERRGSRVINNNNHRTVRYDRDRRVVHVNARRRRQRPNPTTDDARVSPATRAHVFGRRRSRRPFRLSPPPPQSALYARPPRRHCCVFAVCARRPSIDTENTRGRARPHHARSYHTPNATSLSRGRRPGPGRFMRHDLDTHAAIQLITTGRHLSR